ncbi:chloride channel protein [Pedobacter sp.]|uniref:chloride channel protein n=1 Tax=Pedobacter sp. TaxID=1411316 RepID=UPI00396CC6C6
MQSRLVTFLDHLNSYRKSKISNRNFLVAVSVLVGIMAGLAASLLKSLTHHIEHFLQNDLHWRYKYYLYFLFPGIGIFFSVLYVRKFIRKGKFETGLTPLLYTISKKSSNVEPHNSYSQIITAALTVGFGGSTGLEAPIVTSGASIGSTLGRYLGLSYREITLLLACGAAAGIAGAFNSPVAGIVFAIEILLPEFTIPAFIPLLLSAATASVVAQLFYKEQLFYLVTQGWEMKALLFYILLAGLIGLYSIYFGKANNLVKGLFYKIKNPYKKVVVGGIALGILVFLFPTLYGEGYLTIKELLTGNHNAVVSNSIFSEYGNFPIVIILFTVVTIFAKSLATLTTLGAGGNGGIFAPSLIIGGLIGFVLAYTINISGFAQVNTANFIVAGMAAALGSIMHAPLTGIFLIAEITGGYILMVPLMITTALAYLINRSVNKYSIYTKPLAEKGELSHYEDKDTTVLNMIKLKYLVQKEGLTLNIDESITEKISDMIAAKQSVFAVLNAESELIGLVFLNDALNVMFNANGKEGNAKISVKKLLHKPEVVLSTETELKEVLRQMDVSGYNNLPVVDEFNRFVGFVAKSQIFNKYRALLARMADYMS